MSDEQQKNEQPKPEAVSSPQQPQAAPVQYVVMEKNLNGLGGWLMFWIIVMFLAVMGYITAFGYSFLNLGSANGIFNVIFSPIAIAALVTTIVFILMRKKLARLIAIITFGILALGGIAAGIIGLVSINQEIDKISNSFNSSSSSYYSTYSSRTSSIAETTKQATTIGLIVWMVISTLGYGLASTYFIISKRAKETLIK